MILRSQISKSFALLILSQVNVSQCSIFRKKFLMKSRLSTNSVEKFCLLYLTTRPTWERIFTDFYITSLLLLYIILMCAPFVSHVPHVHPHSNCCSPFSFTTFSTKQWVTDSLSLWTLYCYLREGVWPINQFELRIFS